MRIVIVTPSPLSYFFLLYSMTLPLNYAPGRPYVSVSVLCIPVCDYRQMNNQSSPSSSM